MAVSTRDVTATTIETTATQQSQAAIAPKFERILSFEFTSAIWMDLLANGGLTITRFQPMPADTDLEYFESEAYCATPGNFLYLENADARALHKWLLKMDDGQCPLRARPVLYPAIPNSYRMDGTKLPDDFGTTPVLQWDFSSHADFDLLNNGHVTISRYEGDTFNLLQYMDLSNSEAVLLLALFDRTVTQLVARGLV